MSFTPGIDYGTHSVRALVVDVRDGRELGAVVVDYPSGKEGILLNKSADLSGSMKALIRIREQQILAA
jgi:ribulose kinase